MPRILPVAGEEKGRTSGPRMKTYQVQGVFCTALDVAPDTSVLLFALVRLLSAAL